MEVGVRGVTGGSRGEFSQRLTPAVLSAGEGVCVGQLCCAGQVVFSFSFFLKPGDEAEVAPLCIYSAVGGSGSRGGGRAPREGG